MIQLLITIYPVFYDGIWHIRMISVGSCETDDWSNDAENSALPSQEWMNDILNSVQIENGYFKL